MKKIELLMPAGDLTKLKVALLYGADAVFIGGKKFSLRAKASNFTLDDIKAGMVFAHSLNKKVYVTVNIIPHYNDLANIKDYLIALDEIGVDAIIVSSLYIIKLVKELNLSLQCHVSTQLSATNSAYLDFYQELGCTRVVLARECSIEEIKLIHEHNPLELEVFIQGGLCSSISGKCTLSNYFVLRDANRGGCAHSCRWDYTLYDGNKIVNPLFPFKIASKDLMGINQISKLISIGVTSLKVEGRMKSINYIAMVAKAYRRAIDAYYSNKLSSELLIELSNELRKVESRPLCEGFLNPNGISFNDQIYLDESKMVNQTYLGYVEEYDEQNKIAKIIRKNDICLGQEVEIIAYDRDNFSYKITTLKDENGDLTIANKTEFNLIINAPIPLKKYYLIRKK